MSISGLLRRAPSMTLRKPRQSIVLMLSACVAVTGCASSQPLPVEQCPTLPPPPAMAMKKFKPDYRLRLQSELLESVPSATK